MKIAIIMVLFINVALFSQENSTWVEYKKDNAIIGFYKYDNKLNGYIGTCNLNNDAINNQIKKYFFISEKKTKKAILKYCNKEG